MSKRFAIIYFTATNNSLYIANKLSGYLEADVYNMADTSFDDIDLSGYEGIGVVAPVYCGGIPNFVEKVIFTKLSQYKDKYHFGILNYGSKSLNAVFVMSEAYRKAGLRLSYYDSVKMPENFVVLMKVPSVEKISLELDNASEKTPLIARNVMGLKKMLPAKKKIVNYLSAPIYNMAKKNWHKIAQKFRVDGCNRCSICAKECPAKNISFLNGELCFSDKCEFCLRCMNICPKGAITWGIAKVNGPRYMNKKV